MKLAIVIGWPLTAAALMAWVSRHDDWYVCLFWAIVGALVAVCQIVALSPTPAAAPAPPRRPERHRAYLVVHLDLSASPPVAKFVTTYSSSAKDLTLTGLNEARADLYMCEAPTLEEALEHLRYIQPSYFPWATPLMTRKR